MPNRRKSGERFNQEIIEKVWEKAQIVPGFDPQFLRKDKCGAMIARVFYGECSETLSLGWEIDHIKPIAKGGTDDLINLQPLQWENNKHKGDASLSWTCRVSVKGKGNKYIETNAKQKKTAVLEEKR